MSANRKSVVSKSLRTIVSLMLTLTAANAFAQAGPVMYTAEYQASYKGHNVGTTTFTVSRQDGTNSYIYESVTKAKGLIKLATPKPVVDRSLFDYTNGKIRPVEFWHEDGSRKGQDNEHIQFDWQKHRATMTGDFGTREVDLEPGTVDRGSLQVALTSDLGRGVEPKRYAVADGQEIDVYTYTAQGTKRVETGIGEIEVVSYVQEREGSSRQTVFDMAPSLDYIPVRIEQFRNGEPQSAFLIESLKRD